MIVFPTFAAIMKGAKQGNAKHFYTNHSTVFFWMITVDTGVSRGKEDDESIDGQRISLYSLAAKLDYEDNKSSCFEVAEESSKTWTALFFAAKPTVVGMTGLRSGFQKIPRQGYYSCCAKCSNTH